MYATASDAERTNAWNSPALPRPPDTSRTKTQQDATRRTKTTMLADATWDRELKGGWIDDISDANFGAETVTSEHMSTQRGGPGGARACALL